MTLPGSRGAPAPIRFPYLYYDFVVRRELPEGRLVAAGTGIALTDNGPGSTLEVAVAPSTQASWTNLTLENSWTAYGANYHPPQYYKDPFGFVNLRGVARDGGDPGSIATLPVSNRPLRDEVFVHFDPAAKTVSRVHIRANGQIYLDGGGAAVQSLSGIRFHQGFNPSDAATPLLWSMAGAENYQLSTMATPAVADADPVGGVLNYGSAGNFVQATAGKRPTLRKAVINGFDVWRFDGSDDELALGSALTTAQTNVTVFAVVRLSSTSKRGPFVKIGNSASGYGLGVGSNDWDTLGNDLVGLREGIAWEDSNSAFGTGNFVTALTIDGSEKPRLYKNGTLVHTSAATDVLAPAANSYIGGYSGVRYFGDDIAEVIVYGSLLSDANRALVTAYLGTKYGIAVS